MYGVTLLAGMIFVLLCIEISMLHDVLNEIKQFRRSFEQTKWTEQDPGAEYWRLDENGNWEVRKDK